MKEYIVYIKTHVYVDANNSEEAVNKVLEEHDLGYDDIEEVMEV